LQRGEAAPHPDPLPASGAREQFDDDGSMGVFFAKMGEMARRYQGGGEPDLAKASLAELFAWCLARPVSVPGTARLDPARENQ